MKSATLTLLLLASTSAIEAQTVRHSMLPRDRFALQDIGEVQLSPDGTRVAFTVVTSDVTTNEVNTRVMIQPLSDGQPANVPLPGSPANLRWSPDGSRLAFITSKDNRSAIWTLEPATGAVHRVSDYDRGNSFLSRATNWLDWSPDGRFLAFAGTLDPPPAPPDPLIITRLQYKTRTSFSDNRRSHIYVVAVDGGAPRQITSGEFDDHSIDWGGDGTQIVFLSNREPDPDATLNYDIYSVRVDTGQTTRLTTTPGVEMEPRVSPDGHSIAYLATTRPLTTIDSVAEDAHLFVIGSKGGARRELNHALDRRSGAPQWSSDGQSVFFTSQDHGKIVLHRVPVAGGSVATVVDKRAEVGPYSMAKRGDVVAFGLTDPVTPREIFVTHVSSGEPRRLTHLNDAAVTGWSLAEPEAISFKSFDGLTVEGWFYRSLATARSPLVLSIHGGPHGMYGYAFNPAFQVFAGHGYSPLAINPRGSSGYGQAFSDGCVNNWGGGDYRDLMAGVDHVLASRKDIDPERLGVTGGSYGGFMTNWIITQTPRFKVAVSRASVSNLVSFYATSLYQDLVHAEFNGFPWDGDNFLQLWKWSPMAFVARAQTPTLFIHGEQDNDVHITQAEEMYTALRRRGIEAVLARYPREGHGFREPRHQLDQAERTFEFMDRFLMPSTRPTQP